jgi:ribosomal protein S18 acetylase RimI-like enzyme
MKGFTIRRARRADVARIAPLFDAYRGFYGKPSDLPGARAFLKERVATAEALLYIAEPAQNPSAYLFGFTLVYPTFSSVSLARAWVLNDLFVSDDARRLGVGRALVRFVLQEAKHAGAHHVELATQLRNASARALYESEGFEQDVLFAHYSIDCQRAEE